VFVGMHKNPIFVIIWLGTVASQVILVEYGSYAFSTKPLTLELWMYCLLFGVGTLVWQQLVTSVPTRKIPKFFRWGQEVPNDEDIERALGEPMNADGTHAKGRHGQILWMRSLTRLQQQLRVVRAFKSTLEDIEDRRSSHSVPSNRGRGYGSNSRPYSYAEIPFIDDRKAPSSPNDLPYDSRLTRQATTLTLPDDSIPVLHNVNERPENVPLLNSNGAANPPTNSRP